MNHFVVWCDLIIFIFPFFQDLVVDLLQSIVEIVTYGDRHDPAIFEYAVIPTTCFFQLQFLIVFKIWGVLFITSFKFCRCFMEYQVLGEFVRVLKISKNSRIEAPLLQYLSIMIQNMDTDNAICKTNEYRMILSSLLPLFCHWRVLNCECTCMHEQLPMLMLALIYVSPLPSRFSISIKTVGGHLVSFV